MTLLLGVLMRDGLTRHLDSRELAAFERTANQIRRLPVITGPRNGERS